jgi:hypothetical protein
MGSKKIDLTGIIFNRLTVMKQEESVLYGKTKKRMWLCKCSCGNEIILNTGALTSGNTKSCGCLHNETSIKNSIKSRYMLANPDSGYKSIMRSYKYNAALRGHSFDLTFEEFKKLVLSNCYYCGNEPSNIYFKNYYDVPYNGIDRIDNSIGYSLINSVTCCKMCNIAKNNNTFEKFTEWIDRFVNKELTRLVKRHPNDAELGMAIRKLVSRN